MTEQELGKVMRLLEKYYKNFYQGMNKEEVFAAWYPFFKDDDPHAVERAVVEVVCTLRFPPTVADIKLQLAEDRLEDQPTATEAFQMIAEAVNDARDRAMATKAYNALPPMIRKLVGTPSRLVTWHRVSEESFETVIMSAIRSSYETLAKREAKYYALPAGIRKTAGWRIEGAETQALPEPLKEKTVDDILAEMDKADAEYRQKYVLPKAETSDRLNEFLKPMTDEELKAIEARKKRDEDLRMERMKE